MNLFFGLITGIIICLFFSAWIFILVAPIALFLLTPLWVLLLVYTHSKMKKFTQAKSKEQQMKPIYKKDPKRLNEIGA